MQHLQEIKVKYMFKTDRIQIKDVRFKKTIYIKPVSGNVLTDIERFLNDYNYKVIGYSSNFETDIYTLLIQNRLDINSFRPVDKAEYSTHW